MKIRLLIIFVIGIIGFAIPVFAEIMPSGSAIAIATSYNSYVSGDKVFVRVDANLNSNVTISMIDPLKNIVKHVVEATDERVISVRHSFYLFTQNMELGY